MRKALFPLVVGALVLPGSVALADTVVADFAADYQPGTPKAGWAYEWTSTGPIGTPSNYGTLLFDPSVFGPTNFAYDVTPGTFPSGAPASYTILSKGFMHPGQGVGNSAAFEHYTIAAFTVPTTGQYAIENLSVFDGDAGGGDGVDIFANVDSAPAVLATSFNNGGSYSNSNISLGTLTAGQTVYVAIGAKNNDGNDSTGIGYQIARVPEPASASLVALGAAGLLRRRRR